MATALRPRVGARAPAAPLRLPEHWPLAVLLIGYPLWWVLGLSNLIWPVFALPMAGRLLMRRRSVRVPSGFGLWLLFLAWMFASAVSLDPSPPPLAFLWRVTIYLSVTVFFLYVANAPTRLLPTSRVIDVLAGFWIVVVTLGWLGVVAPYGEITSLVERILPSSLRDNKFVLDLVHPAFAQVQDFLGYPLGRPKAPFSYTNDWGAAYALLCPFFFASWLQSPVRQRRISAYAMLAASLVPVFISLNRGLWLSLGVALVYASTRLGPVARLARRALLALATVGLLILVLTPIRGVVEQRAETPHSNAGREYLYGEAVKLTNTSPIIGFGAPQEYRGPRILPALGTQGQLWLVLVSQGYVGTMLFVGFLIRMMWTTRKGPSTTFWCHVVLIIGLVQLPVYDMMPAPLHLIFIAAALGIREMTASEDEDDGTVEAVDAAAFVGR